MRNPLKKLQKKINFRLANNAAQHSQPPKEEQAKTRHDSTTSETSVVDQDDPLFNNRSSKLRLALAESKKTNSNSPQQKNELTTPKKKKRGKGRISFGGSSSRRTHSTGGSTPDKGHSDQTKDEAPRDNPKSPQKIPRTPPKMQQSNAAPKSIDRPTKSSLQHQRDKAEITPSVRKEAPKKPAMVDPNLERIAKAAAALDNTGNELFEKGEYDKAMATYVKALKLKNRSLAGAELEVMQPKADIKEGVPKTVPAAAKATLPEDAKPEPDGADNLWISVATSINNIGYLRQQSGQASADETMKAYQNSLQIKRRVLGKDNLSVGKTLNNLGTVHYLKREYKQALQAYHEALQIMMATLGPLHLDVGTVHSNIGDVYWAQSGDSKLSESDCPQENYQASRNAALQHYRQSLAIRWEQLQDHHDAKIVRLLEKIGALEMGDAFLTLVQNSHKHRRSPKGDANGSITDDPDEAIEAESGHPLVQEELQNLHAEVRKDVKSLDMMERKLAIDMVKDKLRLMREMKKISTMHFYGSDDEDDFSVGSNVLSPTNVPPLSPEQREEALSAVKDRLQQLRDARNTETDLMRHRFTANDVNDLKEADRSPSNFFLSQKASHLLNRTLQPAPTVSELDELRKFSFHETENDPEAAGTESCDVPKHGIDMSRKTEHALGEGIDALRSLSVNRDNISFKGNPWQFASSMTTPAKKQHRSPTTSLLSEKMAQC